MVLIVFHYSFSQKDQSIVDVTLSGYLFVIVNKGILNSGDRLLRLLICRLEQTISTLSGLGGVKTCSICSNQYISRAYKIPRLQTRLLQDT